MIARKLILPMLATLALSACAHAPAPDSKKTMPMNASAKAYRPHTLDEHPDPYPRRNEQTGLLEPSPPQFRRLLDYFFTRNDVVVQIIPRREGDVPDEKLRHACVERIDVRRFGKG